MSDQSISVIKDKVEIQIGDTIKRINNTLTHIVNDSITNTVNKTVSNIVESSTSVNVSSSTAGLNMIDIDGGQSASGGGKINIDQDIKIKATNEAIIKILQNPIGISSMGNDVATETNNKINADPATKEQVTTLAKISKKTKDSGGPEKLIDNIVNTLPNLSTTSNDANLDKTITNSINIYINNTIIDETDITNIINTSITSKTKQTSAASCNFNVTAINNYKLSGSMKASTEGEIDISQSINIESVSKCLIELQMGDAITNTLLQNVKFKSSSSTTNSTNPTNPIVGSPSSSPTTSVASSESNNTILYISLGVGGLVIFLILIFFLTSGGSKRRDNYKEQYGSGDINVYNNLYLYAALFILFLFISSKSITICGLILVIFVTFVLSLI